MSGQAVRLGFTLAEVLVTLGIIGVVSAMTVPTLMQNHQRKTYVTQLHKVYNEFSQALLQYQTDKNALNLKEAGLNSQDELNAFIKSYFKVVKECDNADECFSTAYNKLNGAVPSFSKTKSFVLSNGASIRPLYGPAGQKLVNLGVDINGAKGPNIQGRDLFWLMIYNNALIDDFGGDAPLTREEREDMYNTHCASSSVELYGCFGKILNDNWEMNY